MRRLTVVITLILVAFWAMSFSAKAQPFQRPGVNVVWELAAWAGQDALGQPQTQDGSGEDWLYSITQSKTAAGEIDGFVAAGYSTSPNVTTTFGCQIPCSDLHGCTFATIMKIGDGGEVEWYRNTGIRDPFWKVINTSDGGFLAVGHTHDRSLFTYNPQVPGGGIPLDCWPIGHPSNEGSRRLIFAAKFDHNGNEEWKYAYGKMDNPNDHFPDGPLPIQRFGETAWDVVERPDGGFRIVACAYDPDTGFTRAFVIDVDADGVVQDRQVYGEGDPNDPSTWKRSMLMGIDRWGDDYIAVGTQYGHDNDGPGGHANGPADVFIIKLGEKLTQTPLAQVMLTNTPDEHDTGFSVAFAGDGTVHVASVLNCDHYGACRRSGAGGEGDLVVHRLDRSTLAVLGSTGSALGRVKAFDVLVGLTSTSDGGVALVSTKQPNGPIVPGSTDNTDAFVAKLSSTGAILWTATYDARTARPHFEAGYNKHQECVYDIAEAENGDLVIVGNNSSNHDDFYAVRFSTKTSATLPASTISHSHLVYPTTALPSYAVTMTGDLNVRKTGRVWVDSTRTLKFGQGNGMLVSGYARTQDATLTEAVAGQGWSGISVMGTLEANPGTTVEHATTGVTVYQPGTATLTDALLRSNGTGLDVRSNAGAVVTGTTITQNGTGITSGVPQEGPGAPLPCFAFCRSTLSVSNSEIIDNTGNGVYAISVNADIQHTVMSGNGGSGLRVSDARVDPFTWNVIEENGLQAQSAKAVPGVWILAGGDLQMHLDRPNDSYGYNRLANNGSSELTVAAGGTAFIGNSASNGRNSIYNTNQGGVLVANYSGAKLDAVNTFWGSMNAPPAGALAGSVEWDPVSSCDYTVSPPSCVGLQRGVGDAIVAGRGGEEAPLEALRAEILAVRAALAEHPASEAAPELVRTLAALHRRDRDDQTGERGASWGLLRSLRARLNTPPVPAALRATVEAALEVEAVEALTRGESEEARALVTLAPLAEDRAVGRVLRLVEAHLEAQAGRYTEAAALVEAVAAEEVDADMAEVLIELAAVFAERAGEGMGGSARGTAGEALARENAAARGEQPGKVEGALAVYPNPSAGPAVVMFTLEEALEARVAVYDVLGRRVALLAEGPLGAGTHRFHLDRSGLPAGIYIVQAEGGARRWTERITLVR